jgi:hypothetical protein
VSRIAMENRDIMLEPATFLVKVTGNPTGE